MELCPRHFSDGSEDTVSSQDEEKHYGDGESPENNKSAKRPIELKTKSYHHNGNNKTVTFSTKQLSKMSRVSEEVTEDLQQVMMPNNESATTGQNSSNGTPAATAVNIGYESSPHFLTLAETNL